MQLRFVVPLVMLVPLALVLSVGVTPEPTSYALTPRETYGERPSFVLAGDVTAASWGVFDATTGEIVGGRSVDTVHPIASITKLFTAYAVSALGVADESVTLTDADIATEGRSGSLRVGDTYTLRELSAPLILESSNDAGAAMSRVLGPRFPLALKVLTEEEEFTHTTIVDGTGLSPRNESTVRELAQFLSVLRERAPYPLAVSTLPLMVHEDGEWVNNNPAHTYTQFEGGKQGVLPEAGQTFLGSFRYGDTSYTVVILGSSDMRSDLSHILDALARREDGLL